MADLDAVAAELEKTRESLRKAKGCLVPLDKLRQIESYVLGLLNAAERLMEGVQAEVQTVCSQRDKEKAQKNANQGS